MLYLHASHPFSYLGSGGDGWMDDIANRYLILSCFVSSNWVYIKKTI